MVVSLLTFALNMLKHSQAQQRHMYHIQNEMFRLSTVVDSNLSVRFGREMMKLLVAFNALQIEKCYI